MKFTSFVQSRLNPSDGQHQFVCRCDVYQSGEVEFALATVADSLSSDFEAGHQFRLRTIPLVRHGYIHYKADSAEQLKRMVERDVIVQTQAVSA